MRKKGRTAKKFARKNRNRRESIDVWLEKGRVEKLIKGGEKLWSKNSARLFLIAHRPIHERERGGALLRQKTHEEEGKNFSLVIGALNKG